MVIKMYINDYQRKISSLIVIKMYINGYQRKVSQLVVILEGGEEGVNT